ncbi:MAG: radical SAM protein [Thermoguttaceae bacterium]|nr:radical SAM protein [Thermoguttaceae bacterium]
MQWHIIDRCNLRCVHCYQEQYQTADPSLEFLIQILEQYEETLDWLSRRGGRSLPGMITVTGGEPFLHSELFALLERIVSSRFRIDFAVLTNGTMITESLAKRLARLHPRYVQVSLDGGPATHDQIRGQGAFAAALAGLDQLHRARIRTVISFTASRLNQGDFRAVVHLARAHGIDQVWSDRLIPTTLKQRDWSLSPGEAKEFFEQMNSCRMECEASRRFFSWGRLAGQGNRTQVTMRRAGQFLTAGGPAYRCAAARSLVAVLPDGTLLPCRRMPIPVGRLSETTLLDLYRNSPVLKELRRGFNPCPSCPFGRVCQGGLRCLSYAVYGTPFAPDPGCPLSEKHC